MKQITQRMRNERARRQAMGIELIERPLRFIASRDSHKVVKQGVTTIELGPTYKLAKEMANCGDGGAVQRIAKALLHD